MKIRETTDCRSSKRNLVFKDMSALDFSYNPPESPVRKEELLKLLKIFKPVITLNTSQFAIIHGAVGTGKTELVKRFSKHLKKHAIENSVNVHFEFINCRYGYSNSAVVMKILNRFQPNYKDRGHSINEMLKKLSRHLENQRVHMIVMLEEADKFLEKRGSKLICQLSNFNEGNRLSLVLISQKNVIDLLDSSLLSRFKSENIIHLKRFTKKEIQKILHQRTEVAFNPDIINLGVVELISDIASEWSDVRYALELLEKAGLIASEQNTKKVTVEHVRMAKAETYSTITESKLVALDLHEMLILLAIAQSLRRKAYSNANEVEHCYAEGCKVFGLNRVVHSQFLEGLNVLATSHIIVMADVKGEDSEKATIALHDFPAISLEAKLIELYCSDKKHIK